MIKVLYPCDPSKNTECAKTACQQECTMTTKKQYATDDWKFKDLKISPGKKMGIQDYLFIKTLEMEGAEHESNGGKA